MFARAKQEARRLLRPLVKRARPKRTDLPLGLWGLSRNAAGALSLGGVDLTEIMREWGSPVHVVDAEKLARNATDFLADGRCEVFYSYKTNPIRGVLERLHAVGIGAEVISPYELWLAGQLGVPAERIVYNGPAKTEDALRDAIAMEVGLVNLNCREEIEVVARTARALRKRPRVGLRVVVPGGWGGQFGEPCEGGAALRAFTDAHRCGDLHVVAVHVHAGGEIASRAALVAFVHHVLDFCDEVRATLGVEVEIVDFGGSLACPSVVRLDPLAVRLNHAFGVDLVPRAPESVLSIREYVGTIAEEVEHHFDACGARTPRIFVEPGRSMTGNTQLLLCSVVAARSSGGVEYAVLDAGINVAEPVRGEYHQLVRVGPSRGSASKTYRLAGPICTPMDVLYGAWELEELRPTDALAILDSGAYFVPFATSFSFPQPAIVMVEDGRHRLLRRAEQFEDLARLDQ